MSVTRASRNMAPILRYLTVVTTVVVAAGGPLPLCTGCARPLRASERVQLLDALDSALGRRLFDPARIDESWSSQARQFHWSGEESWSADRELARAINVCMRELASHNHVHPPSPIDHGEVDIPWVTVDEGVSVLRAVRSEGGRTLAPGELIVGSGDAREMRRLVEWNAGQSSALTIRETDGTERIEEWKWSATPRRTGVESRTLPDGTLLVRVDSFTGMGPLDRGNFPAIREHLRKAIGASALILDLRGNPGGGRASMDVGSLFFKGRRVFAMFLGRDHLERDRVGSTDNIRRVRPEISPLPWVTMGRLLTYVEVMKGRQSFAIELSGAGTLAGVRTVALIDEGTRSAAEMLASFLHEQCGATLIGRPSAGECAMPVIVPLVHGWRAHIAAMRIASGTGIVIEGRGLQPDIHVVHRRADLAVGRDADLEAAVAFIRKISRTSG